MQKELIRYIKSTPNQFGNLCYWLSRDQRVSYNHALLHAQKLAIEFKSKLFVVFNIVPEFLDATIRQYDFMLKGLSELGSRLRNLNIPLYILQGAPEKNIPAFIDKHNIKTLITDFDPLRIKKQWKSLIAKEINITFMEVDTHNIVPAFYVSEKKEFGAYTIRRKIWRLLPQFLVEPETLIPHPFNNDLSFPVYDIEELKKKLKVNKTVQPVSKFKAGESEAKKVLETFIKERLPIYHLKRNDPNEDCQSNLSPYLHFGQIS